MKTQYFYKKCNPQEKSKLQSMIESKINGLSRLLASNPNTVLEVKMEKTAKKSAYIVELVLRYEGKRFVSKEDDHTIHEAVDFSRGDLMGQLRRIRLKRGVKSIKQFKGRRAKDEMRFSSEFPVEDFSALGEKEYFDLVERFLKKGRQYIVSEIRFFEKTGELQTGEVEADELVNDVVLELWNERNTKPLSGSTFLLMFYSKALQTLNKRKVELARDAKRASLESRIPQGNTVDDDEELEFWQPDDVVTLVDTLALPLSTTRHDELRSLVLRELRHIPHRERQEFNLVYQSGFTIREVARIVDRSVREVESDITRVHAMLKKKFSGK